MKTQHSNKMVWGCAAVVGLAVIVAFVTSTYALLFVIPCMLMMGVMLWMMMGGTGDRRG